MQVDVPQYLSRPMCVLWFETDEIVVGLMTFIFAMAVGGFIPVIMALVIFLIYRNFRKKAGRGFLIHLPYMIGLKTFQGFPHSYVTKFEE